MPHTSGRGLLPLLGRQLDRGPAQRDWWLLGQGLRKRVKALGEHRVVLAQRLELEKWLLYNLSSLHLSLRLGVGTIQLLIDLVPGVSGLEPGERLLLIKRVPLLLGIRKRRVARVILPDRLPEEPELRMVLLLLVRITGLEKRICFSQKVVRAIIFIRKLFTEALDQTGLTPGGGSLHGFRVVGKHLVDGLEGSKEVIRNWHRLLCDLRGSILV